MMGRGRQHRRGAAGISLSPSRLDIKTRQIRVTNCLGRMTRGIAPAGQAGASTSGTRKVKWGTDRPAARCMASTSTVTRKSAMGRPVVLSLGAFILILLAVAFFF